MSYTKGNWSQGVTLKAKKTMVYTKEQMEFSNSVEKRTVFADFDSLDEGRGRRIVANCASEEDAERIALEHEACRGITSKALKRGIVLSGIDAIRELNESKPHPFFNGLPTTNPLTFYGAVVWEKDNLEKK